MLLALPQRWLRHYTSYAAESVREDSAGTRSDRSYLRAGKSHRPLRRLSTPSVRMLPLAPSAPLGSSILSQVPSHRTRHPCFNPKLGQRMADSPRNHGAGQGQGLQPAGEKCPRAASCPRWNHPRRRSDPKPAPMRRSARKTTLLVNCEPASSGNTNDSAKNSANTDAFTANERQYASRSSR